MRLRADFALRVVKNGNGTYKGFFMNKKFLLNLSLVVIGIGLFTVCWATAYNSTMSVLSTSLSIIFSLCEITGVLFIGISFIRYQQYRQNPSETPLSRVLYVLLFGLILLILPNIAQKASIHTTIKEAADTETGS